MGNEYIEFTKEEAEALGAFEEDALTTKDIIEDIDSKEDQENE